MEVFGRNQSYPLGQQADLDRRRALGILTVTHLTIQITSESVNVAIGRKYDGVRISSTSVSHDNSEKSRDESRLTFGLGAAMSKLTVYTPAPRKKTPIVSQSYRMMLTCHCLDNDFLCKRRHQLGIGTLA